MKKNCIIFDADGVLLDTLPYFIKWLFLNVPNFNIVKLFRTKFNYLLEEFADDYDSFSNIPPIKGSVDFVKKLSQNYKVDVISACGGNVRRFLARTENIEKYFGNSINKVINIPLHSSKENFYNQYEKGTVVIDDDMNNCRKAFELGLKPFNYKYYSSIYSILHKKSSKVENKIRNKIKSVSSFAEIEKYLLER
ncbi:MAG: hypothetical protein ACI4N3_03360 [Alphaproteobacteria bacterium]